MGINSKYSRGNIWILVTNLWKTWTHEYGETDESQLGYLKRNLHRLIIIEFKNNKENEKIWKAPKCKVTFKKVTDIPIITSNSNSHTIN